MPLSSGYPAGTLYPYYFFHFAFAATATTIVSGAVAERVTTIAYGSFAFTMASFIYPVVARGKGDPCLVNFPLNSGVADPPPPRGVVIFWFQS